MTVREKTVGHGVATAVNASSIVANDNGDDAGAVRIGQRGNDKRSSSSWAEVINGNRIGDQAGITEEALTNNRGFSLSPALIPARLMSRGPESLSITADGQPAGAVIKCDHDVGAAARDQDPTEGQVNCGSHFVSPSPESSSTTLNRTNIRGGIALGSLASRLG